MDRERYSALVDTFFKWDQSAILSIVQELLGAVEAADSQAVPVSMSQNYETAQENPEIHILPGNLKDARDSIFPYFWGTDSWNNPLHVDNVKGPANHASLIGSIACILKNPNLCTDRYSQRSNELEVKAVTALANLIFYHTEDPWGVFTIGGTISNFYGAKIGLEKVLPGAMQNGLGGCKVVGLCSEASHYSNLTIAGWLGIGTKQLIKVPTDENLAIRLDLLEQELNKQYESGAKVAFVVATFGTTDGFGIDDITSMREIMERVANEYDQPTPQLHADAAVGWALSFMAEYAQDSNPLQFSDRLLEIVGEVQKHCERLREADSVTIDFHKMGRGHYPSSAFIVNRRDELKYLARDVSDTPYFSDAEFRRDPALFTLECSRPAIGPYAVMASLNGIGLTGWRMLVARSLELAERLKAGLEKIENCRVLNRNTAGVSVNWWVLPKGRDANAIYEKVVNGELDADERQRYFGEIRQMYQKREKDLDQGRDARLGFTTSFGYCPHGIEIPAWKAVFFNPATTDEIVDRIIEGIQETI